MLLDVNVLVYAHREDSPGHDDYRTWLEATAIVDRIGLSELALSGFVRIVTHPRTFTDPTPVDVALDQCATLLSHPAATRIRAGPEHWRIFDQLCRSARTRGNLVADAYHAALAIEHGATWITTDRDFARFERLDWRHPLER